MLIWVAKLLTRYDSGVDVVTTAVITTVVPGTVSVNIVPVIIISIELVILSIYHTNGTVVLGGIEAITLLILAGRVKVIMLSSAVKELQGSSFPAESFPERAQPMLDCCLSRDP